MTYVECNDEKQWSFAVENDPIYIKQFLHFSCDKNEIVVVFFPLFLKDLTYEK